jgi:hypothetical protein
MKTRRLVQIGQVWKNATIGAFKITKIVNRQVFAVAWHIHEQVFGRSEEEFAVVADDGYTSSAIEETWVVEEPCFPVLLKKSIHGIAATETRSEEMEFFSRPHPGNCKCDIPKHQCRFHKDC